MILGCCQARFALYALGELGSCLEDAACHPFISGLTVISRAYQCNAANSKVKGMILLELQFLATSFVTRSNVGRLGRALRPNVIITASLCLVRTGPEWSTVCCLHKDSPRSPCDSCPKLPHFNSSARLGNRLKEPVASFTKALHNHFYFYLNRCCYQV